MCVGEARFISAAALFNRRFQIAFSLTTNDARYTREINSRFAMAKPAFNKKKALFTSELDIQGC